MKIICPQCGGKMQKKSVGEGGVLHLFGALLIFLFGVIVFLLIPIIGWIVGPCICLVAILAGNKSRIVYRCRSCGIIQ